MDTLKVFSLNLTQRERVEINISGTESSYILIVCEYFFLMVKSHYRLKLKECFAQQSFYYLSASLQC